MVRCGRCGRILEDPKSIARGYGPYCWAFLRQEIAHEQALHNGGLEAFCQAEVTD